MDYSSLFFYQENAPVSHTNAQAYYSRRKETFDESTIALVRHFHRADFWISGTVRFMPMFAVSNYAREHLIYPIAFLMIEADSHYYTSRADLDAYELRYTLSGEGRLEYENKVYHLKKGEGFLIDCRRQHDYRTVGDHWNCTVFHFQGEQVRPFMDALLEQGDVTFCDKKLPNFEMLQFQTLKATQKTTAYIEYEISCLITLLLTELLTKGSKNGGEDGSQDMIRCVVAYMNEHYKEQLSVNTLLHRFGISRTYLDEHFKHFTGLSPKAYLMQLRINRAKSLLQASELSIEQISAAVGFNDSAHFIQIFKKYAGSTPLQFRKRKQPQN